MVKIKFLTCIVSYNTPEYTKNTVDCILNLSKSEDYENKIIVIENSTDDHLTYKNNSDLVEIIDLGRQNIYLGGCTQYIFDTYKDSCYDYVGILNNDLVSINPNMFIEFVNYIRNLKNVGIISASINKDGTGWNDMKNNRSLEYSIVNHVENICSFYNVKLFNIFRRYFPLPKYCWIDVQFSKISRDNGYVNIICHKCIVEHMLSGTLKKTNMYADYLKKCDEDYKSWINNIVNN